ncbi:MAG: sensor domain-containing diguanylate cyclase [Leptolyngbyaceae cyanobacterium]
MDINIRWIEWSEQRKQYELDELPLGFTVISLSFIWFLGRCWIALSRSNSKLIQTRRLLLSRIRKRSKTEKTGLYLRKQLERRIISQNRRAEHLQSVKEMGELLIFAQNKSEILNIAVRYAKQIIPVSSGAIYETYDYSLKYLRGWGTLADANSESVIGYRCWATRRGKVYAEVVTPANLPLCAQAVGSQQIMCVPILTPRGVWGVLRFRQDGPQNESAEGFTPTIQLESSELKELAEAIADAIGLHVHNLYLREQLTLESVRDPLTGVLNRRGLLKLVQEQGLLEDPKSSLTILFLDLDSFKQFNDKFGHDAGDTALISITRLVSRSIRQRDIFCRYGGEEFLLLLTGTDKSVALSRAEKIRRSVEQHALVLDSRQLDNLTVSIGVASYPEDADSYASLVKRADEALYQAKKLGRNQVVDYAKAGYEG